MKSRFRLFLPLILLAAAAPMPGFGQTVDGTSNTFVGAIVSVGNRPIQVFLTVTYADNLAEDQYVDVNAFRQDTTAAIQAVVNQNAPLEVFSAAILNALFTKYTQVQSLVVQVAYQSQTVNQQTIQSQRTRIPDKTTNAAGAASSKRKP